MAKVNIGIEAKNLKAVAKLLSDVLANQHVLYIKTRNYHWNVSGPSFMELHTLFEAQYEELARGIDEVAERISKLGEPVPGTMAAFIKSASLKEDSTVPNQSAMISNLVKDHEACIKSLRNGIDDCEEKYEDSGTADMLTGLMRKHETNAWKLRRYLK